PQAAQNKSLDTDTDFKDANMGRVRTKTTKRASRVLIEKYYPRLTLDFHTNKRIIDEVAVVPSKRLRNKISGFTTHLMKRIQKGPVRGISFKLQEEERERKDNYVPEVSALDTSGAPLEVDADTKDMLRALNFDSIPCNVLVPTAAVPSVDPIETGKNRPWGWPMKVIRFNPLNVYLGGSSKRIVSQPTPGEKIYPVLFFIPLVCPLNSFP
ncbi:hypothetical protein MPER_04879, partial [Moniliophthora perniciosa FA553]